MNKYKILQVEKRTLLAIAGIVWMIAGINVARMGLIEYLEINNVLIYHLSLSLLVFLAFGSMFYRMTIKHTDRIHSYEEEMRYFWHFFDLKAYLIMTFMMGGGIWMRSARILPPTFIAVFYSGLGIALMLAGLLFWVKYFKY
ncbi:MAG: hypothetical protein PUI85_01675 [Eubacteriales bacterium]|nr:hypothetical protein [Eubacteriales bacterium]